MIHRNRIRAGKGILIAVAMTALAASGCKSGQEQPPETQQTETSTQAVTEDQPETSDETGGQGTPNPMAEVKDVLAFETIGVHMVLPEDASDTSFFIINNQVADARFTADSIPYTYRASDTAEDFAGIFERFKEDIITETYEYGDESAEVLIRTTDSGGRLSSWEWGSTKYTLYTASPVDDHTITDLTMKLVELSQYEK